MMDSPFQTIGGDLLTCFDDNYDVMSLSDTTSSSSDSTPPPPPPIPQTSHPQQNKKMELLGDPMDLAQINKFEPPHTPSQTSHQGQPPVQPMIHPAPHPQHLPPSHLPPSHLPPSHLPPSHLPPQHLPPQAATSTSLPPAIAPSPLQHHPHPQTAVSLPPPHVNGTTLPQHHQPPPRIGVSPHRIDEMGHTLQPFRVSDDSDDSPNLIPTAATNSTIIGATTAAASTNGRPNSRKKSTTNPNRLKKKAEAARDSRKRKKQYVANLECQVKVLTERIEKLKARKVGQSKKRRLENGVVPKKGSVDEKQFHTNVEDMSPEQIGKLCERFVSDPDNQLKKADYYLERVKECVRPGDQVKFLLWFTSRNEEFYKESGGMWNSLLQELGLTPEQIQKAAEKRKSLQDDHENVKMLRSLTEEVNAAMKEHLDQMSATVNKLRSVLTKDQMVKFYLWVLSPENDWAKQEVSKKWKNCIQLEDEDI